MADIPMGSGSKATVTYKKSPTTSIGLATNDTTVDVIVEGIGPVGPVGPQGAAQTVYVQEIAPNPAVVTLHAGDMWIKKPPVLIPQPTFIWDGTAWLPIYGEGGGGGYYEHVQSTAKTRWVIVHLLHHEPAVTVKNTAGNTVRGSVTHVDNDNLTIDFSEPIAGVAYLS